MPDEYEKMRREWDAGSSTLLLDLQERITKLEATDKYAEVQRTEMIAKLTEIHQDLRTANLEMMGRDIKEQRDDIRRLWDRVDANSKVINEAKTGFTVGVGAVRTVWSILGVLVGTALTLLLAYWKK